MIKFKLLYTSSLTNVEYILNTWTGKIYYQRHGDIFLLKANIIFLFKLFTSHFSCFTLGLFKYDEYKQNQQQEQYSFDVHVYIHTL